MDGQTMMKFGVGQPLRRVEDQRFLTGTGRYADDKSLPGQLHAVVVRSMQPSGRLTALDIDDAKAVPGVKAIYTGADLDARAVPGVPMLSDMSNVDGSKLVEPHRPVLVPVGGAVRFVGDQLAFVVADSREAAEAAAERIVADIDDAPFVVSPVEALADGAPLVHDDRPGNLCVHWRAGDADAVNAALEAATHRVTCTVVNNRVIPSPLETRAALAYPDAEGGFGFTGAIMNVFMYKRFLSHCTGIAPDDLRVYADDIGGGFGAKNQLQPEHILTLLAAKDLDAPVKWVSSRSDGLLTDIHARGVVSEVTLGFDDRQKITALKVDGIADIGAYASTNGPLIPTIATAVVLGGAYDIPANVLTVKGAFTNTAPTDAYRGAGRPEATYLLERALEVAAQQLGVDAVALRRRNLIDEEQLPYNTAMGKTVDSGRFLPVLDAALDGSDWDGFAARAADSAARGKKRGFGVAHYMECTLGGPQEYAQISLSADGRAHLTVGTQNAGMGHETSFRQLIAAQLGLPPERIDYHHADTGAMPIGGGHGGSRSLHMGGSATHLAAVKVEERLKQLASAVLEADVTDIERIDTDYAVVGTDQRVTLTALIERAGGTLAEDETYSRENNTFPNGAHCCELELDPETGVITLENYVVVDDFGTIVNPLLVTGQIMGGVAQGIGQAWREQVAYDPDSGQLLSGSFMDYCLPRADEMIGIAVRFDEAAPSPSNPIGVKGCGEAGAIAATPAFMNAVCNALGHQDLQLPLTSEKVWRAIR